MFADFDFMVENTKRMSKQTFEELLAKYLAGTCTDDERRTVEQWYELSGTEPSPPTEEKEWQQVKESIWQRIKQQTTEPTVVVPLWRRVAVQWGVAASVGVLLLSVWWLWFRPDPVRELVLSQHNGHVYAQNLTPTPQQLSLPDGSKVKLLPQATFHYPTTFGPQIREVFLSGDAFFEVAHNPDKPFVVSTGKLVTKVLGTSFWVRQKPNNQVEVAVRTGKVAVFERTASNPQNNGVLLTPNHKVVYFAQEQHFVTGLVEQPEPIAVPDTPKPTFNFTNESLGMVIQTLERAYGIKFATESPEILNCPLTGDLTGLPMFTQLEIICESLGAKYEVRGTSIVLSGNGCE